LIGSVGVPRAVGIAITRYSLYEKDILMNRTLVYGTLTAMQMAETGTLAARLSLRPTANDAANRCNDLLICS
jgi:hypothetical protein